MSVQSRRRRTVLDRETRREQLVDAAIAVFAYRGYRAASVADIIGRAGVARGTFYLYFKSKEDAFNAALDRFLRLFKDMARRETERDYGALASLEDTLRTALGDWLRFLLANRALTKIVFRQAAAVDPDYERKYAQIVRATQAHSGRAIGFLKGIGVLREDLDPGFLNAVFYGATIQIVLGAIAGGTRLDVETVADQWIRLLRAGILRGVAR